MNNFNGVRETVVYEHEVGADPDTAFVLLCPAREYDWIDVWRCEMIHSKSGAAELDCVFRTEFPELGLDPETWQVCRYEPPEVIEFAVMGRDVAKRYTVSLCGLGDGKSLICWKQVLTGLTDQGNRKVRQESGHAFSQRMGRISRVLDHYLRTGQALPMAEAG